MTLPMPIRANMEDRTEANNVYASTPSGKVIHVSQATSPGRGGYFCLGCKKELQAVHSKTGFVVDYFRHHPDAVKNEPKCAYRDLEHRHGIAIRSLLRDKRILLPAVIKRPPIGVNGFAYVLQEPVLVQGEDAKPQLTFFENSDGLISWSNGNIPDNAAFLTKAAVTFFDVNGKPILLIELSGESKMKVDKLVGFKRLGIDVVRITVPRDAPDAIEGMFQVTANTKWIYSHEEDNTAYDLQFASGSGEALLDIGSDQSELFQENFNCRAAEIRSLIRTIGRCLESKPYADVAGRIRGAVAEVGKFIERDQRRLAAVQDQYRGSIEEAYQGEEGEIDENLKLAEEDAADLERRYFSKIEEIGRDQRACDAILRAGEDESLEGADGIERRRRELIEEARGVEAEIRAVETATDRESKRVELSLQAISLEEAAFQDSLQNLKNRNEEDLRKLRQTLLESSKQTNQEEATYKELLKQKRLQSTSNLKNYERQLLVELRDAIKTEIPNFPPLLEDFWLQEDWSKIGVFIRNMQTEQGQLEKRLKTSLIGTGISFESYMEAFDHKGKKRQ
jgi:hypothetical protein